MLDPIKIFDRAAHRHNRARAARRLEKHDFLVREVADRLADRVADMSRRFETALGLGSWAGLLGQSLAGSPQIGRLIEADTVLGMLPSAGPRMICDEEILPIGAAKLDLALALMTLHWVNDLPGALVQLRAALKPDGLFLGAILGGTTLAELRDVLATAEAELNGAPRVRVSPMADLPDMGGLLMRAGFALPVVDADTITVTYEDAFSLMADLRGMGEANVVAGRPSGFTARGVMLRAAELYQARHGTGDGRIGATFQILFLTGWAPHPCQPKALRPGSASEKLADALDTVEQPTGDKAGPDRSDT